MALAHQADFLPIVGADAYPLRIRGLSCLLLQAYPDRMRDESLTEAIELVSSERLTVRENLIRETGLSLELPRTMALLAIFVGLLILRFS